MILIDLSDLQVSPASDIGTLVALDNRGNTIRAQYIEPASQSDMDILESQMSTIQSHYIPQLNRQEVRLLEIESDIARIREELSSMPSIENRINVLEQKIDDKIRLQEAQIAALHTRLSTVESNLTTAEENSVEALENALASIELIRLMDEEVEQNTKDIEDIEHYLNVQKEWLENKFTDYPDLPI